MTDRSMTLSWLGIVRLGLVQASLGAVVVLTTSIMNRVMVVELALPAMLPGALVAWHYLVQVLRPRLGHGSDAGGRRTPWIIGGMTTMAFGGFLAAVATALMGTNLVAGVALAIVAFTLVGLGAGGSGTALLVLMAQRAGPARRPAAATIAWVLMFAGFVVTAATSGRFLDPFTPARLVEVTACVAVVALMLTMLAVWGVEGAARHVAPVAPEARGFVLALREVWSEPASRRFAIFVFLSMLAYSALELILDPFAGQVFGFTPGASTKLSGLQHGGALAGMILVALVTNAAAGTRAASLRVWTMGGCAASAMALVALAAVGLAGPGAPLQPVVFVLGLSNGVFAVAAIGSMMQLVGQGASAREGVRMGLWGAAQAVAFAGGGIVATTLSDIARAVLDSPAQAYACVFGAEAFLFVLAARQAAFVYQSQARRTSAAIPVVNTSAIVSASGG